MTTDKKTTAKSKQKRQSFSNDGWLGRMQIIKPKKGAKVGIPVMPWHHLAIIDDYVFVYIWDTRDIIDVYRIADLKKDFETTKIIDNGKQLLITANTSKRAANAVKKLLETYDELPISVDGTVIALEDLRKKAEEAIEDLDDTVFSWHEGASTIFVDKNAPLPKYMYMFREQSTFNPDKLKFVDNNAYLGRAKYFAILARCAILKDWAKLIHSVR